MSAWVKFGRFVLGLALFGFMGWLTVWAFDNSDGPDAIFAVTIWLIVASSFFGALVYELHRQRPRTFRRIARGGAWLWLWAWMGLVGVLVFEQVTGLAQTIGIRGFRFPDDVYREAAALALAALVFMAATLPAIGCLRDWKALPALMEVYGWLIAVGMWVAGFSGSVTEWLNIQPVGVNAITKQIGNMFLVRQAGHGFMIGPLASYMWFFVAFLLTGTLVVYRRSWKPMTEALHARLEAQGGGPELTALPGGGRPPRPARNATASELPD